MMAKKQHPSHKTRFSDSSIYDEVCVYCGATDARGDNGLFSACPSAPEDAGELFNPLAIVNRVRELHDAMPPISDTRKAIKPLLGLLEWKKIDKANPPPTDVQILFLGPSGYGKDKWYVRSGTVSGPNSKFFGNCVGEDGERISDGAPEPTHWTWMIFDKPPEPPRTPLTIDELLEKVKGKNMTAKEIWKQRRSFAEGNYALAHPEKSRAEIRALFDSIDPEPV